MKASTWEARKNAEGEILNVRLGDGLIHQIRRGDFEGTNVTEGQKIRRFRAYSVADHEAKIAAGFVRAPRNGAWVKVENIDMHAALRRDQKYNKVLQELTAEQEEAECEADEAAFLKRWAD